MFGRKKREKKLLIKIDELNEKLIEGNFVDMVALLGDRKKLLLTNLTAGISRGIGIGIGVTLITAILIFTLQRIVKLNIPVIGEYISDIADIVEKQYK